MPSPALARSARYFLEKLEKGEPLPTTVPCPVQVLRFGHDLTLVGARG